jgi:probable addiction module antidote protein
VAEYLSKAFKGEPTRVAAAIVNAARSGNMVHLTRAADVSSSNLYRLLTAKRDLKLRTAIRLIDALGMQVTVRPKSK